jgi:hypothetical protein
VSGNLSRSAGESGKRQQSKATPAEREASGNPPEGGENNAIIKITNIYQGRGYENEKNREVELARGEQALVSLRLIQRPTSNFE